jgi:hypothetical protein
MSTVPPHRSPEDVATHTVDTIIYLLTVLLVWLVFIGRYIFAVAFIIGRRVYHLGSDPAFHQVMRQLGRRLSEIVIGVFNALRGYLGMLPLPFAIYSSAILTATQQRKSASFVYCFISILVENRFRL